MLLLVIALLALLPLLAVLQYHWLGEVSLGERERMKENLRSSAAQFGQDFDREIRNVFLGFQSKATETIEQSEAELAAQYQRWQATALHPKLVGEIYQTRAGDDGSPQLLRFNRSSRRFERVDWPGNLQNFHLTMLQQGKTHESARMLLEGILEKRGMVRVEKSAGGAVIHLTIGPVDDELPGVVIPVSHSDPSFDTGRFNLPLSRDYRLVALNLDYLQQELLPEMAARYFAGGGVSDYHIAVTRRGDPQKVIFQTEPGPPAKALTSPDVTDSFFRVRINDFDRIFLAGGAVPGNPGNPDQTKTASGAPAEQGKDGNRRVSISVLQSDIRMLTPGSSQAPADLPKTIIKVNTDGAWQLAVKHRAGSLEAAVAAARRRNLAISFGILLLLGVSVGLIVMSSRRAQKLAIQQMEFVAGVSHELRTPLAVICSAGENLADGVIDNREQIKSYGGLIRDEGRRLTEMVEQVLEFAGAQSGRRNYQLKPVRLNDLIDHALNACHRQLIEGGFEVENRVAVDLPPVKADAAALSRAIQNLLNNAIKYSGESRWIGLSSEVVKTDRGVEIEIRVSDRGMGIASHEMSQIFEPFYRGREVSSAQIHGNGLGLNLVKQIIEAHGGRVSVTSKLRAGTTFTLHLPIADGPGHLPEETGIKPEEKGYEQTNFAR